MIALTVMAGSLNKKGKLTLLTKLKLWSLVQVGRWLHFNRVSYRYVFPQGAEPGQWVRPCDAMSMYVLLRDPYSAQVHVPDRGVNLLTREERIGYVDQIVSQYKVKVFGVGVMFHPAHYRGLEDDPMKDIFNGDMPVLPTEHNVVPIRRRP